jgi:hypothetical protein
MDRRIDGLRVNEIGVVASLFACPQRGLVFFFGDWRMLERLTNVVWVEVQSYLDVRDLGRGLSVLNRHWAATMRAFFASSPAHQLLRLRAIKEYHEAIVSKCKAEVKAANQQLYTAQAQVEHCRTMVEAAERKEWQRIEYPWMEHLLADADAWETFMTAYTTTTLLSPTVGTMPDSQYTTMKLLGRTVDTMSVIERRILDAYLHLTATEMRAVLHFALKECMIPIYDLWRDQPFRVMPGFTLRATWDMDVLATTHRVHALQNSIPHLLVVDRDDYWNIACRRQLYLVDETRKVDALMAQKVLLPAEKLEEIDTLVSCMKE